MDARKDTKDRLLPFRIIEAERGGGFDLPGGSRKDRAHLFKSTNDSVGGRKLPPDLR